MTKKSLEKQHSQVHYLSAWIEAMRYGLLDGRPYSAGTIECYELYARWFFERFDSIHRFRQALLLIPVMQFAKREKIYRALSSFARYLIQEGKLEAESLEAIKPFRPKRHLPPRPPTRSVAHYTVEPDRSSGQ